MTALSVTNQARIPHVLYLIDVLWGLAGAEGALLRAVQRLPKDLFRCSVATFRLRPELSLVKEFPCPVHEFPLNSVLGIDAFRMALRLRRFIRSEEVDIVHTFFETSSLWGGLIARLSGVPVLISSRRDMGILRSGRHRLAYRLLHGMFDQVQAVSQVVRNHAIASEGLDPERVVVIPNGIEFASLHAIPPVPELRCSLGVDSGAPLITTVCHIRRIKGLDVFLRAAAIVCRRFPKAAFVVVGGIHESDHMAALQNLARDLGLMGNVHFTGKKLQADVWAMLKTSSVFCLLSHSEGMSNALLEAMACGLPSVVTAVGGTPEVVEDGRTGFLVRPGDAEDAARRILTLLESPERARAMGECGRRLVEEHFSADRVAERLANTYRGLLDAHS